MGDVRRPLRLPGRLACGPSARAAGVRLILVTGRQLPDLAAACPHTKLFDRIVAENGAILHTPATGRLRTLAAPPPPGAPPPPPPPMKKPPRRIAMCHRGHTVHVLKSKKRFYLKRGYKLGACRKGRKH